MRNISSFILYTYRKQVITGLAVIIGLVVLILIISKFNLLPGSAVDAPVDTEVAVTEAAPEDVATLSPYLYFSALAKNEEGGTELHTYVYDLSDQSVEPVSVYDGDHSFSLVDERHALFVGRSWVTEADDDVAHVTPLWSDYGDGMHGLITTVPGWNERDLVAHPNGEHIAFSQQPALVDDEASRALSSWEVVIARPVSGDVRRIPGASSPQWVGDNLGLVYLKEDGIYYTTADGNTETKIFDGYRGLTRNADLAATADGSYLAVTVPGAGGFEVLQVEDLTAGAVTVVYTKTDANEVYRHPVFDRNGTHFAMVYFRNDVPVVEIRNVTSDVVVAEFTLNEFTQPYFALNDWSDILVTAAQYSEAVGADHHAEGDHHDDAAHE